MAKCIKAREWAGTLSLIHKESEELMVPLCEQAFKRPAKQSQNTSVDDDIHRQYLQSHGADS